VPTRCHGASDCVIAADVIMTHVRILVYIKDSYKVALGKTREKRKLGGEMRERVSRRSSLERGEGGGGGGGA
jgi:uncharacterized membrane protein YgcG